MIIENELQLKVTKKAAKRFKRAIDSFNIELRTKEGINPKLIKAEFDGLVSMYVELKKEIAVYESKKGTV